MDDKKYNHKMVIITESDCRDGVGNEMGKTVLTLRMVFTAGDDRGKEITKICAFEGDPPEFLRREMLRLGFLVSSASRLKKIAPQLSGILARVSLAQDGGTSRVYIDDYFGRDNPVKYAVKG